MIAQLRHAIPAFLNGHGVALTYWPEVDAAAPCLPMADSEHDPEDARVAGQLLMWAEQLRDENWDQPGFHRRALAALMVAQTTAGYDAIEHQLLAALIARMRHRAGMPPSGSVTDQWREQAYFETLRALELMAVETPPLTGQMYVRAVTDGSAPE